jgi:arsenite methyltransferase
VRITELIRQRSSPDCLSRARYVLAWVFPHLFHLPTRWIGIAAGAYFLFGALSMLCHSKVGKLRIREEFLDSVPWRGDDQVLDVGCGPGLLLVVAARRLRTGRAVGVDAWVPNALAGNGADSALENAACQGVRDRAEVREGDARQLPFPDASFDLVLSNFVPHEMKTPAEREAMVREIARVLKPGGHVALRDFIFTDDCVRELQRHGVDARRERVGRLSFWVGMVMNFGFSQLYHVTAQKAPLPSGPVRGAGAGA